MRKTVRKCRHWLWVSLEIWGCSLTGDTVTMFRIIREEGHTR